MRQICYIIQDRQGLHARNAAQLSLLCQRSCCSVKIVCKDRTADARDPIELMSLRATVGDELTICIEGEEEELLLENMEMTCKQWL